MAVETPAPATRGMDASVARALAHATHARIAHAPGPAGHLARTVKLADIDDHLGREPAARHPAAPPYAWARRHIAIARSRRGETDDDASVTGAGLDAPAVELV